MPWSIKAIRIGRATSIWNRLQPKRGRVSSDRVTSPSTLPPQDSITAQGATVRSGSPSNIRLQPRQGRPASAPVPSACLISEDPDDDKRQRSGHPPAATPLRSLIIFTALRPCFGDHPVRRVDEKRGGIMGGEIYLDFSFLVLLDLSVFHIHHR
mgnify:CR=1 FL=1